MKPVENPGAYIFRSDIKAPIPAQSEKKKSVGKSFMSLFKSDGKTGSAEINDAGEQASPAELEQQLDQIHDIGQKLLKMQTLEQVKAYKAAVKAFMQYFLQHGIEAEEMVSNRSVLNQKKYTIIRIIDEKLERLVTGILQSQVKQMEILSKLEEIQGLLVNLMH